MTIDKRIDKRNADLERINENLDKWHRVLTRAVNKINKLRKAREQLLKPRKLKPYESEGIKGEDWTRIRDHAHVLSVLDDTLTDI